MRFNSKISMSIKDVNLKKWDDLADLCFLKSDSLRIVENLELGRESYYLEIYDKDKLAAIAVFYGQNDKSLYYTLEQSLYGVFSPYVKPIFGLNPAILCYFPYAPSYEMFKIDEAYDKEHIFGIIEKELRFLAGLNGYKSYGVLNVSDKNLIRKVNFFSVFSGFKVRIKIRENSFEEFVKKIDKKSHRAIMKKDRRLFSKGGYKVEKIDKLNGYEKRILDLFDGNLEKYDKFDKNISNEFIKAFDANSKRVSYFIGTHKDSIYSALMVIEDESRVVTLRVGQSVEDGSDKGFAFFNIAIYEPLVYAIKNLKSSLELGTGSYNYKVRRGAELYDNYNLIQSTNRFKNMYLHYIIPILDRRNRKKHLSSLEVKRG